jgi:Family of unknown function (DUF5767)
MSEVPGADLLMNSSIMSMSGGGGGGDISMPALETVTLDFSTDDLPMFGSSSNSAPPADKPRLVPSADDVGVTRSWDGVENLNAEAYLKPVNSGPKLSEDAIAKRKYELLRKFERLGKMGVPIRKRFTMDSLLDEMELELEFVRKEKAMDSTIKQFSEWFITGMSALEWGSKNVNMMKMFGLQLDGLSQSAQMNVGDLEEDFEELYELYGDKMRMHPLVRIPMRTCFMVYMVHLTNQMAMKAPVPNIEEILRTNPDIARQMAAQAMQTQTQQFRQMGQQQQQQFIPPPPPPSNNPLSGLMSFLGGTTQPPPPESSIKTIPARAPVREMKPPTGLGIGDILKNIQREEKKIAPASTKLPPPPTMPSSVKGPSLKSALRRSAGSTDSKKSAKNSVVIKL